MDGWFTPRAKTYSYLTRTPPDPNSFIQVVSDIRKTMRVCSLATSTFSFHRFPFNVTWDVVCVLSKERNHSTWEGKAFTLAWLTNWVWSDSFANDTVFAVESAQSRIIQRSRLSRLNRVRCCCCCTQLSRLNCV